MTSFIIGGSAVAQPSPETPVDVGTNVLAGNYSTLSKLRTFLSLASADTGNDSELLNFLKSSSRRIDRHTRRHFYPLRNGGNDTLKFDLPKTETLRLDEIDVLEVYGLSDLNGASEIDSGAYWLKTGDRWNITPYGSIELNVSTGSVFNFTSTPQRAIRVDAVTGYNENYKYAWIDSAASLTSALGTTTTMASISGSAGFNADGDSPRFSAGQLWRLGSGSAEEFVYVQDTVSTSVVRLIRAVNGTSRTTHASTTKVFSWQPEKDIEESTLEVAAFMFQKSMSPFTNRISHLQLGIVEMPDAWPEQTRSRLKRYKKQTISSF